MIALTKQTTKQRAVGYVRVSSPTQLQGFGFVRQGEAIDLFSERSGYAVEIIFFDSYTGTETDRPALSSLFQYCERENVKVVFIENLNRLARDLSVQTQLLALLEKRGFSVYDAGIEEEVVSAMRQDPMRRAMIQVCGVFSELEKNLIVHKLKKARKAKKEKTGRCEGVAPYGELPGESECYNEIVTMFEKNRSPKQIAGELNRLEYKTRTDKKWTVKRLWPVLNRLRQTTVPTE